MTMMVGVMTMVRAMTMGGGDDDDGGYDMAMAVVMTTGTGDDDGGGGNSEQEVTTARAIARTKSNSASCRLSGHATNTLTRPPTVRRARACLSVPGARKQAGRQAAGRPAGKRASKQAGRQTSPS